LNSDEHECFDRYSFDYTAVKPCWLLPQYENRTRLCADLGEQVKVQASQGEIEIAKSVVSVAELVHGAYRAKTPVQQQGRLAFIERLSQDVPCPSGDARHVRCSRI
jgi:hypothetical protein